MCFLIRHLTYKNKKKKFKFSPNIKRKKNEKKKRKPEKLKLYQKYFANFNAFINRDRTLLSPA